MPQSRIFTRSAALFATTCLLTTGCTLDETEYLDDTDQAVYAKGSRIWDRLSVPVCWENPSGGNVIERGWVRDAITRSWEYYSQLRFTGWGTCYGNATGIRILIDDQGPSVQTLGSGLDGMVNGMDLNFTFQNWSTNCASSSQREGCIRRIAIHEFGHAIGFAHEHNRPDTPSSCTDAPQGDNGDILATEWDIDSVMNYCYPDWLPYVLSDGDIQGVRYFYGGGYIKWSGTSSWDESLTSFYDVSALHLADFDGDGRDDVFRASGDQWFYGDALTNEWTPMASSGMTIGTIGFGDFDGDGKTDVFRANGSAWYVSYGGVTSWQFLRSSSYGISQLRFGDFDGDGKTDVFRADGSYWYASYSGTSSWSPLRSSLENVDQLAFGDFDGDGKTDALYPTGTQWKISYGGITNLIFVKTSTKTVDMIAIGDFNGDGASDVFYPSGTNLRVSYNATSDFSTLSPSGFMLDSLALGDLDGDGKTDVVRKH